MSSELQIILPYISLAAVVGMGGGILAFFWAPGIRARSAVQHFAAGVVIATVASELMPEVEKTGRPLAVLVGFAVGGVAMIGLKWLVLKFEKREKIKHQLPVDIAAAAATDTFIDGSIISAGFSSGQQLGVLLTLALALELFFLNLSVGSEFHKFPTKRWQGFFVTIAISLMLIIGALITFVFLRGASENSVTVLLAFGAAALIYLIAEELLVESIQAEESLFSTAMLFPVFS